LVIHLIYLQTVIMFIIHTQYWSIEIYIPYAGATGMLTTFKWKVHNGKIEIISFVVMSRFQTALTVIFEV
jgi:hypothetical protein